MHIPTLLALGAAIIGSAFSGSPFGSTSEAANELCGQTITDSLTLTADQTCTGNAEDGVVVTADTVGMIFEGNVSGGNGGHGIALQSHPDSTTLKKNQLIGNVRDGVFVDVAVQTTAIVQNAAFGNGVSGFNVDNTTSTLTKNLVVANLASGIRTPFGAVDGGGNQAHDNLGSPQCTPPIACP